MSTEVRAALAAEYMQDLDRPECRGRTRAPVAGTIAIRQCDETPENSIDRTIDLEHRVAGSAPPTGIRQPGHGSPGTGAFLPRRRTTTMDTVAYGRRSDGMVIVTGTDPMGGERGRDHLVSFITLSFLTFFTG
jgi:hypothetical protein